MVRLTSLSTAVPLLILLCACAPVDEALGASTTPSVTASPLKAPPSSYTSPSATRPATPTEARPLPTTPKSSPEPSLPNELEPELHPMFSTRYGEGLEPPEGDTYEEEFGSVLWNLPSEWSRDQDVYDVDTEERVRTYLSDDGPLVAMVTELNCASGDADKCATVYRDERASSSEYLHEDVALSGLPDSDAYVASGLNPFNGKESVAVWVPHQGQVYEFIKVSDAEMATWLALIDTVTAS